MALKAGRVGLNKDLVDEFGYLKEDAPSGEYYTKTQADNKFETKTHVNNNFQKKTLEVPIELLSGSALTVEGALQGLNEEKFNRAEQMVLGAKNLFNFNDVRAVTGDTVVTISGADIRLQNTVANTYMFEGFWLKNLPKNTDVVITMNVAITSGSARVAISDRAGATTTLWMEDLTDGAFTKTFNTGNWEQLSLTLYCTTETSEIGDVTYSDVMIRFASDSDDTYVPYAMTNREITEELAVQESACTDIISGATATKNHIIKYGHVVFLSIEITGITATAHTDVVAKIPDGFKPLYTVNLDVSGSDAAYIGAGGSIALRQDVSNRTLIASATWITS